MDWHDLPALFPGLPSPDRWLPLLRQHARLLEEAAPRVRVSAVPPVEAVRRHYAESLEAWRLMPHSEEPPARLADVGSGGGFPGMVIAIVSPETDVHLVEPLGKRARLLREIAAQLRLPNVTVHGSRAEEAGRGPLRDACQVAVARAVAEARELVEYLAPLVAPGGVVVMPKGSRASEELKAAERAMTELGCEFVSLTPMRPAISETALVAVLRKLRPTPDVYPRRAGVPHRRPL